MFQQSSAGENPFVQQADNQDWSQDKQNVITYGAWNKNLSSFAIKLAPYKHRELLQGEGNVISLSQTNYLLNPLSDSTEQVGAFLKTQL